VLACIMQHHVRRLIITGLGLIMMVLGLIMMVLGLIVMV
jgi:hypothetical protein